MPNATTHRIAAGAAVFIAAARDETMKGQSTLKPVAWGALACATGTLPDRLEPASHPNHRQFFHSWVMAAGVGYACYKLYEWQPDSDLERWCRNIGLVIGGAYLIHLALDALTAKSLPLIGEL